MPSIAEIAYFEASEAYKANNSILDKPLTTISNVTGLNRSYVGFETENPDVLFWVNDWASKDAHTAFRSSDKLDTIVAESKLAFASQPTVNFVEFHDAKGALSAPVTEFVTFTLKSGQTIDTLKPLVDQLHTGLKGTPRFHGDSWAIIVGKPDTYHGILGWDTVEAHWDAVREGPLKDIIDKVKEIADLWLVHVELKPFTD